MKIIQSFALFIFKQLEVMAHKIFMQIQFLVNRTGTRADDDFLTTYTHIVPHSNPQPLDSQPANRPPLHRGRQVLNMYRHLGYDATLAFDMIGSSYLDVNLTHLLEYLESVHCGHIQKLIIPVWDLLVKQFSFIALIWCYYSALWPSVIAFNILDLFS